MELESKRRRQFGRFWLHVAENQGPNNTAMQLSDNSVIGYYYWMPQLKSVKWRISK